MRRSEAIFKIKTYNTIAPEGLKIFSSSRYSIGPEIENPDAIILRSFNLIDASIPSTVKAIGRAGVGINNIPVAECSSHGIPVFNAPGANANAVSELVIACLLMAARHIPDAITYTTMLTGEGNTLNNTVEQSKKKFSGFELAGKTLGVIGLGAIGVKVSNAAAALGMTVIGYDPFMSLESAWRLCSEAIPAESLEELLNRSDFVSLHVTLNDQTRHLINDVCIQQMKQHAILLNFSRALIVDESMVLKALDSAKISTYVTDFPSRDLLVHPKTIVLPHLGASTQEAEENCVMMVSKQIRDFLEFGKIRNSVNFPDIHLPDNEDFRIVIANKNIPGMVSQITTALANHELNITGMLNKSLGDFAFTLIDVNSPIKPVLIEQLQTIEGILSVRAIQI